MKQKWQPTYSLILLASDSLCVCNRQEICNKQHKQYTDYKYLHLVANHSALNSNKNERHESEYKWIWTIVMYTLYCMLPFLHIILNSVSKSLVVSKLAYTHKFAHVCVCMCLVRLKIDKLAHTNEPSVSQKFWPKFFFPTVTISSIQQLFQRINFLILCIFARVKFKQTTSYWENKTVDNNVEWKFKQQAKWQPSNESWLLKPWHVVSKPKGNYRLSMKREWNERIFFLFSMCVCVQIV